MVRDAGVAELVDAGDLKSSSRKGVQVRILPPAPAIILGRTRE